MKLSVIAAALAAELRGPDPEIGGVASTASANPASLLFAEDAHSLAAALASSAAALIVSPKLAPASCDKSLLVAAQPRLAFARAARLLQPAQPETGLHPSTVIDPSAILGAHVSVGPHVVIEAGAQIGEATRIGAGSVIGAGVKIGEHCRIYPRVVLYPGTAIGNNVVLHAGVVLGSDGFGYVRDEKHGRYVKFPQIGKLVIGDYVEIGANVTIDRGALDETVIGPGTKLDNLVHIGHNCALGANVIMAAQVGLSGSVSVGDDCLLGGQVGIGDHAEIEAGSILGGQAGILPHKKFRGRGEVFWGTPAKPLREYLKELATLARLSKRR